MFVQGLLAVLCQLVPVAGRISAGSNADKVSEEYASYHNV